MSLSAVKRATRKRAEADRAWREAIRKAHADGHSLRAIAAVAEVTNPRVHQIIHGG